MMSSFSLGSRICIIGPSNSGKSTLADRLGKRLNLEIAHLDLMAYEPNTNWNRRPKEDFRADHDRMIQKERWIMDGNYSETMPQRLSRATSVIWLDPPLAGCILRYLLRSLRNDPHRAGKLAGATKEFSFFLIKYTLINYPRNKKKYAALLEQHPELTLIRLRSMRELNRQLVKWTHEEASP